MEYSEKSSGGFSTATTQAAIKRELSHRNHASISNQQQSNLIIVFSSKFYSTRIFRTDTAKEYTGKYTEQQIQV